MVRTAKHFAISAQFVKQMVVQGIVKRQYCTTNEILADMLYKSILALKQDVFCKYFGLRFKSSKLGEVFAQISR